MRVSDAGRGFVEHNEGCELTAYWDVDGWSIGYGHHSAGVSEGLTITREQADALLAADLVWVETAVGNAIRVPLTQCQFDALADFAYNEGAGALISSTLARLINCGVTDPLRITTAFCMWDKVRRNGAMVSDPELSARRQAEARMFLSPNASSA